MIFVRTLPVRLSACISAAPPVQTYMKFDIGGGGAFMKISQQIPKLVKICQQYQSFYMSTKVGFIVTDIKSPYEGCLRVFWYRAVRLSEEV